MERLKAVEVARQVKDFQKAAELLKFPFPPELAFFSEHLKKLTNDGDSCLREFPRKGIRE